MYGGDDLIKALVGIFIVAYPAVLVISAVIRSIV